MGAAGDTGLPTFRYKEDRMKRTRGRGLESNAIACRREKKEEKEKKKKREGVRADGCENGQEARKRSRRDGGGGPLEQGRRRVSEREKSLFIHKVWL